MANIGEGAPRGLPGVNPARANNTNNEYELPRVNIVRDVFPSDCWGLESIPGVSLQDLAQGDLLEVIVAEVYSPSHFWMLRVGEQYSEALDLIMDEMNEYYGGLGAGRVLARGAVRVGQYCAAYFEGKWHRTLIVSIDDGDMVTVRYVDYGTVDSVSVWSLKPLLRAWGALPVQAVRGRLAGVRPAAGSWRWLFAACSAFMRAVTQRHLYAHLLKRDPIHDVLEIFLINTLGPTDNCLMTNMIRVGYADARFTTALTSDESYLYPRFEALESGATPSFADICCLLADDIKVEHVDAYRRHVPGPWIRPQTPPAHLEDFPSPRPCPPPPHSSPQSSPMLQHLHPRQFRCSLHPPQPSPQPSPPLHRSPSPQPIPHFPLPAPRVRPPSWSPPVGYAASEGTVEVRLSAAEWALLSRLRASGPAAARLFLMLDLLC